MCLHCHYEARFSSHVKVSTQILHCGVGTLFWGSGNVHVNSGNVRTAHDEVCVVHLESTSKTRGTTKGSVGV